MAYKSSIAGVNQYLKELQKEYKIFAPVLLAGKGTYTDTDLVRYQEVNRIEEVCFDKKSNFSPKEVLLPITQTLFYFTEDNWTEPRVTDKKFLLFVRSCDIHAIKRLDDIYLRNGGEDPYYKVLRDKVRFCLIECRESFRNCFCVSAQTNVTDDYDMFVRVDGEAAYVGVTNSELGLFQGEEVDLAPQFVTENEQQVVFSDKISQKNISSDFWQQYNSRCLACGRCSLVCPTCSCFSMQDIFYKDNKNTGERRRVWASCMVDGYTDMAGGHGFRSSKGERMRFRVMHKMYDFKKRFGYPMCVGCGRCDDACPEYISLSHCINKLSQQAEVLK